MSKFSQEWLRLREPADMASRNKPVLAACAQAFEGRDSLAICDLGSGTGASVRAFSDFLPAKQSWTLVDHDADNLASALIVLDQWADSATATGAGLELRRGDKHIKVQTLRLDLSADPNCWPADAELVTTSALLDLTSEPWIAQLAMALRSRKLPLLATLTFDGIIQCKPHHPSDQAIQDAFRQHQRRDKGFGAAAGAGAVHAIEQEMKMYGYALTTGDSAWFIDRQFMPNLLDETLNGIASAVSETGLLTPIEIEQWRRSSSGKIESLAVGHRDLFALPSRA
jgi:hypothetical protein